MVTIDSQVHAYERNHPGRPWAGFLHGPEQVTGDDMFKILYRTISPWICIAFFNKGADFTQL